MSFPVPLFPGLRFSGVHEHAVPQANPIDLRAGQAGPGGVGSPHVPGGPPPRVEGDGRRHQEHPVRDRGDGPWRDAPHLVSKPYLAKKDTKNNRIILKIIEYVILKIL